MESAQSFDNVGLLLGSLTSEIETVLIALDLNREVLQQAKRLGAQLILTHHPIIFKPVKVIKATDFLFDAVCSKLNVVAMHTNLDCAKKGVSFCLANLLNLQQIEILAGSDNFGRIGFLERQLHYDDFLTFVSSKLGSVVKATRFGGFVKKVAVVSGAGGFALNCVIRSGADVFVTGECKHSDFVEAFNRKFRLVVAGHFETEVVFCRPLQEQLSSKFNSVKFIVAKEFAPASYFHGDLKWL